MTETVPLYVEVEVESSVVTQVTSLLRRTPGVHGIRQMPKGQVEWSVRRGSFFEEDDAANLICDNLLAEEYSRALDLMGWMIVPKAETVAENGGTAPARPLSSKHGPVPAWADDIAERNNSQP
jgi:hypothetical protein